MSGVLDRPRELTIGGQVYQIRNYAHLVDCIEIEIDVIQTAEVELDTNPVEAPAIWAHIAKHASYLAELLAAQEQWLAEDDAELATKANELRTALRDLAAPSYKGGKEGRP